MESVGEARLGPPLGRPFLSGLITESAAARRAGGSVLITQPEAGERRVTPAIVPRPAASGRSGRFG